MRRLAQALCLLDAAAACGTNDGRLSDARVPRDAPAVERIATVPLDEDSSTPLGNNLYIAGLADGGVLVADARNGRVLVYGPTGAMERSFGRPGEGPGELRAPAAVDVLPGDSLIGVLDLGMSQWNRFRLADGSWLDRRALPFRFAAAPWLVFGDTLIVAPAASPSLLAEFVVHDAQWHVRGMLPDSLLREEFALLQHGAPRMQSRDSGFVLLLATEPGLVLANRRGAIEGLVRIPAMRRRGTPDDLLVKARARQTGPRDKRAEPVGSVVVALQRLSNGDFAAVHLDVDQVRRADPRRPGVQLFGNYRMYASVVSADLQRACVDGLVQLTTDVDPLPRFRADTLLVLSRRVTARDEVETVLEKFRLDTAGCHWLPTGGVGAPRWRTRVDSTAT